MSTAETGMVKITALQRCVSRAREAHRKAGADFRDNYDSQDVVVLNILRACEMAIDLANMVIRSRRLGIPTDSRDSFSILQREGHITAELANRLKAMVGFRNLAVHQDHEINLDIVEGLLKRELNDLLSFAEWVRTHLGS